MALERKKYVEWNNLIRLYYDGRLTILQQGVKMEVKLDEELLEFFDLEDGQLSQEDLELLLSLIKSHFLSK